MSEMEFAPPKYAQIVQAIRQRIASGEYPPGSTLPSESQLIKEFGVSRPTVVRALQTLQLRGEIDRQHGRGSFVKTAPPAMTQQERPRYVRAVLERAEAQEPAELIGVEHIPAPARVARVLEVAESATVLTRRWLVRQGELASELVAMWFAVDTAERAGLDADKPLTASVRQLLQSGLGARLGHINERLAARRPTAEESTLLDIAKNAPVLAVLACAFDTSGRPLVAVELVLPGELHELEDTYAV